MSWEILFNCSLDIQSDSDASWEGQTGRTVPVYKLLRCSANCERRQPLWRCIRNVIMHFRSADLRRKSERESSWKAWEFCWCREFQKRQNGIVSRKNTQSMTEHSVNKMPLCYSQCPSWSCTAWWELGWNSLQNTLALMRWWGELSLKIRSGSNTWKRDLQDNSVP